VNECAFRLENVLRDHEVYNGVVYTIKLTTFLLKKVVCVQQEINFCGQNAAVINNSFRNILLYLLVR
jgi:hypothetical protein